MVKKIIVAVMLSVVFVGCAGPSGPSAAEIQKMDFGKKPKVSVAKLKGAFDDYKDPGAIKIRLTSLALRRGYMTGNDGIYWKGWIATVEANGKNSYGAYTGYNYVFIPLSSDGSGISAFGLGETGRILHFVDKL